VRHLVGQLGQELTARMQAAQLLPGSRQVRGAVPLQHASLRAVRQWLAEGSCLHLCWRHVQAHVCKFRIILCIRFR
jgi:hypothetical protein